MKLVKIVYGDDNDTKSAQLAQGLLRVSQPERHHRPDDRGYRGVGTRGSASEHARPYGSQGRAAEQMRKYVVVRGSPELERRGSRLCRSADGPRCGRQLTGKAGESFRAGKAGRRMQAGEGVAIGVRRSRSRRSTSTSSFQDREESEGLASLSLGTTVRRESNDIDGKRKWFVPDATCLRSRPTLPRATRPRACSTRRTTMRRWP
jgi:hypothetical protein